MEIRYWILLTFLGALWGSAFMFIKVATPEFGPIALVNARLIIASLIFLPILLRNKYIHLLKPIWKQVLVLAVMNNAIPFTLFSYASFGADSNILAILNATTAFNTMMIAYLWIGEDVTLKQLCGLVIGFIGQGLFASRFVFQWIYSEKKGESYIPLVFWYLSIFGGMGLLTYAIFRKDPVIIVGQLFGIFIYLRNLILIYKKRNEKN